LLAKGGTSRKRPSLHLHKVSTRSNEVSPPTFQIGLSLSLTHSMKKCIIEFLSNN
jgi:hypothetical protein